MSPPKRKTRRVEVASLLRGPTPPTYDVTPHNRWQRRTLEKVLRNAARKTKARHKW